jgi:hypothetical protein
MPVFTKAVWPGDHRDEVVAGALVGAVVIVLGYASGIGGARAPGPSAAAPPVPQPSASAPPSPGPGPATGSPPSVGGPVAPAPVVPPVAPFPVVHDGHDPVVHDGHDHGGMGGAGPPGEHGGHGTAPAPSASGSTGDDGPEGEDDPCADGSVHLVQPVLGGITGSVTGLLGGLLLGPDTSKGPVGPSAAASDGWADVPAVCSGPESEATPRADTP